MLSKLSINNYALIDKEQIVFAPGFTIVTGETGSGKSIMLGALSLLTGGRADTRVVTDRDGKTVVEGVFVAPDPSLQNYFNQNDLDWNDEEMIIRREITGSGRSRAFVNDRPVNLSILTDLSEMLIDIHSQHENVLLSDPRRQLEIVDSFSDNQSLRQEYSAAFRQLSAILSEIKALKEAREATRRNRDFLLFQLEGLDALKPKVGELAEIEKRFDLLSRADEMREDLQSLCQLLGANERGALDLLYSAQGVAQKLGVGDLAQRLSETIIEVKDIYETADDELSAVDGDPHTMERLSKRMQDYYKSIKQFKVKDADALALLHEEVKSKLRLIDDGGAELPALERRGKEVASRVKELGEKLTASRREGAENLAQIILSTAIPLGLPNMKFEIEISAGKLGSSGQDKVLFLTSFNKNQSPSPIGGQASGGEMARLMLAVKGALAGRMNLPTVIFDEVDTGVSGEIAHRMGKMMREMSSKMQVMAITHLPQVAAKGDEHLKVYKRDEGERTLTHIRKLDPEQRVREIAAMMSGSEVGEAALQNARNLLEDSNK